MDRILYLVIEEKHYEAVQKVFENIVEHYNRKHIVYMNLWYTSDNK